MNRTSAVTLFCRNNCIAFVRFRLIGEFMDFSSQILHFVFLHYAIQAEKARFRVTAAVTLFVSALARRTSLILQKQKKRPDSSDTLFFKISVCRVRFKETSAIRRRFRAIRARVCRCTNRSVQSCRPAGTRTAALPEPVTDRRLAARH